MRVTFKSTGLTPRQRVSRALVTMMRRHFTESVVLAKHDIAMTEDVPTMSINGVTLRVNPKFVAGITDDQLVWVLCHEADHVKYGHVVRLAGVPHDLANQAGDAAINDARRNQVGCLPDIILPETLGLPEGKTAERYASDLLKRRLPPPEGEQGDEDGDGGQDGSGGGEDTPDGEEGQDGAATSDDGQDTAGSDTDGQGQATSGKDGQGQATTAPSHGEFTPHPKAAAGQQEAAVAEWQRQMASVAAQVIAAGKADGWDETFVDAFEAAVPETLFERIRRFATERADDTFSYRRPSRREVGLRDNVRLSVVDGEGVGLVCLAIDTSGSMSEADIGKAYDALKQLAQANPTMRAVVVQHDTRVAQVETLDAMGIANLDPSAIRICGRGGTMFACVAEFVRGYWERPSCILHLTDGMSCDGFEHDKAGVATLYLSTYDGFETASDGEVFRVR